jgi:hypothetical protein
MLHNLHIDHAMIQSELRYLVGAKIVNIKCRVLKIKLASFQWSGFSCGRIRSNSPVSGGTGTGTDPAVWTGC